MFDFTRLSHHLSLSLPLVLRTSREDGVGVEILTDINVALHDGVEGSLVDTNDLHTQERRLEDGLWAAETLVADGDDLESGGVGNKDIRGTVLS